MKKLFLLSLLIAPVVAIASVKNYNRNFLGTAHLVKPQSAKADSAIHYQMDLAKIEADSLFGRLKARDLPADKKGKVPDGLFKGVITMLNGNHQSFGVTNTEGFAWEAVCTFDNYPGVFKISKLMNSYHFIATWEGKPAYSFEFQN